MKKIILLVALMLLSVSSSHAGRHGMKHANPMPNLMRIALGNAELLDISKEQVNTLRSWGKVNKPKMMMMVKQVMQQERLMREEALGADKNVLKLAEKMLTLRKKIIEMKTRCRQTLKSVLNAKQYSNVVSIYKSMRKPGKGRQCQKNKRK